MSEGTFFDIATRIASINSFGAKIHIIFVVCFFFGKIFLWKVDRMIVKQRRS